MSDAKKTLLICIGYPLAIGVMFAMGPIGGVIVIVVFLWAVANGASLRSGGGDDNWNGRP